MKPNHRCNQCAPKIGVVVPARNEQDNIEKTLYSILHQTLKPVSLIVVDDNSTDNTKKIAESMGVKVIPFPYEHENWVIRKELALVFNMGLDLMGNDLDYVTIVGADDILPLNYLEYISKMMHLDNITIASGEIGGESNTIPRGSGRLVNWKWWQSVGGRYPVNYGYESWLLAKCKVTGNEYKVYSEIKSSIQRPTGQNYANQKYIHRGQAYRALGYTIRFIIARSMILFIKKKNPTAMIQMLKGYIHGPEEFYDADIRQYFRDFQNKEMSIKNIPDLLRRLRYA